MGVGQGDTQEEGFTVCFGNESVQPKLNRWYKLHQVTKTW